MNYRHKTDVLCVTWDTIKLKDTMSIQDTGFWIAYTF